MILLEDIQRNARFAAKYEDKYLTKLSVLGNKKQQNKMQTDKKEAMELKNRVEALDKIIKKLLEQNALGIISDQRFAQMATEYESEQVEIKRRLFQIEEHLYEAEESAKNAERFITLIKKYTEVKSLDAFILNELIDKIYIGAKQTNP